MAISKEEAAARAAAATKRYIEAKTLKAKSNAAKSVAKNLRVLRDGQEDSRA